MSAPETPSEAGDRDKTDDQAPAKSRRLAMLLPLLIFAVIGGLLLWGLLQKTEEFASTLIGAPVPEFELPAIEGREPGLKAANLKGEVSLVNVFASWCVACRVEHPLLMELKKSGVLTVHGLNYKDEPAAARAWLRRFGDPYSRVGADRNGRVGIDFGVYGVPESFLIDREGRIVCKHIGAIDRKRDWEGKLKPALAALKAGKPVTC